MSEELTRLVQAATDSYSARFGTAPRWVAGAPGRVNLIGEHIDYNDGFVLPMAIDRYSVVAAGGASEGHARLLSSATGDEVRIELPPGGPHATPGHWSNYMTGVLAQWADRFGKLPGFQAVVESSVPIGGGLSSSASLEVATATLLEAMTGESLPPVEKALLCQKAEHEYPGVPCGIMDQFAAVFGRADHLLLLDCLSQEIEYIPLADPQITVLIINSLVKHELAGGEYAQRRDQCESVVRKLGLGSMRDATMAQLEAHQAKLDDLEYRRGRHAISEIARTVDFAEAIKRADWSRVGQLMYASHESLRDDYEVSCRELDLLVDLAREIGNAGGVIGSRMTGGGFGGCTVSLVETPKAEQIAQCIAEGYEAALEIEPSILMSRPSQGARILVDN